jgi:hypothetical protein
MPVISKAPDATVFLSTAALIIGIFLAATAAALVASLPDDPKQLARPVDELDNEARYRRLLRASLFSLLTVNTVGTLFSFTLLLADTLTEVQSAWIWVAFSYTLLVIVANLSAVSLIYLMPMRAHRRRHRDRVASDTPREPEQSEG